MEYHRTNPVEVQSMGRQLGAFLLAVTASVTLLLTGCTLSTTATDASIPGTALQGKVFGGNQAVVGAHVYLMAAAVSGVGSAGYGLASTSLLNSALTGNSDSIGAYVLTGSFGQFSLDTVSGATTYFYTCPSPTAQVYLYVQGGNSGAGTNSAASFMAALGACGNLSSSSFVVVNEVTTVATAYALAGFATDALHISIPQYASATQQTNSITDALAQTGLQNAFATVDNLVNNTNGIALTITPAGNAIPITAMQVNTLANILASCVNSTGPSSANCATLLNNAGSTGTIPSETATAAINIAHNPYGSSTVMSNLYGLQAASGAPFANGDSSQPKDFTISIFFSGGGLSNPNSVAIDASGNVWTANFNNSLSEFSNAGTAISPNTGYTGGGLNLPFSIALDASGNVWTANRTGSSVSEFSSTGSPISSSSGYIGAGINAPYSIAIDASGNVWTANFNGNSLSKFSSSGSPISPSGGYVGGGLNGPYSIAFDASGNAWTANFNGNSISEFSSTGSPAPSSPYTGGGVSSPIAIAIDASGNAWAANFYNSNLSKFSSAGSAISSGSGYTGGGLTEPWAICIDSSGNAWVANNSSNNISNFSSTGSAISSSSGYTGGGTAHSIAIDGSGNVWVDDYGGGLTEFIGASTPVVTPIVANLIAPYSAPTSKP